MSIAEYIRSLLLTADALGDMPVTVDFLSDSPSEASIEAVAVPESIKEYTDGSRLMGYDFILSLRLPWFGDEASEGAATMEKIAAWMDDISETGLPSMADIDQSYTPIRIRAYPNRYGVDGKNSSARFQAICSLVYLDKK